MTPMTYLTRRYSGWYYLRIRVTFFSKRRRLLRFSLATRDIIEARHLVISYLSFLLPMQHADRPGTLFATILEHGRAMILAGPALSPAELSRRHRFAATGWQHLHDWRRSHPCPIREYEIYGTAEDVRLTLTAINEMVAADKGRLGIEPDPEYPRQGHDFIYSLAYDTTTGQIRNYYPEDFELTVFEDGEDVEYGLRSNERSLSDLYQDAKSQERFQGVPEQNPFFYGLPTKQAFSPTTPSTSLSAPSAATVDPVTSHPEPKLSVRLSRAKRDYLDGRAIKKGDRRADEDAGLVIDFLIDFVGDLDTAQITSEMLQRFEFAMARTPDRVGIPRTHTRSLHTRFLYGQEHGLDGLKMISESRIRNVWHRSLHDFFAWCRSKTHQIIEYKFDVVPDQDDEPLQRDAWTDDELLKLFSLPLFTGCKSKERFWSPGNCLVQNELYWGYLIIFFCGLRNSEIGVLRVADVVEEDGVHFFDLGTKQRRTVRRNQSSCEGRKRRRGKTAAARRRVPINKLLIDLGLIDRVEDLKRAGVEKLFPEWKTFSNPKSGRDMPGHHLSKSWQYVENKFQFVGDELTIYGGRRTRANWYDEAKVPELVKRKLLGHAQRDAHEAYGANVLTVEEAKIALTELPIHIRIAGILIIAKLRAYYDELTSVRTW